MSLSPASADEARAAIALSADQQASWMVDLAPDDSLTWQPLSSLHDPAVLGDLGDRVAMVLGGCERRVAVSTLQLGLAARLWSATVVPAARLGVVPDVSAFSWTDMFGAVRLAAPAPSGWLGSDLTSVLEMQRGIVLAAQEAGSLSAELLWGNVAAALSGVRRVVGGADVAALVTSQLEASELQGHVADGRRTHTCCLFYRVGDGGLCGDCIFDVAPRR